MFGHAALLIPIPARRFNFAPIRTGGQRLQAKVNADLLRSSPYGVLWRLANEINIPASPHILSEIAALDTAGNRATLPEPEHLPRITNGILQHLRPEALKGTQRSDRLPRQRNRRFFCC